MIHILYSGSLRAKNRMEKLLEFFSVHAIGLLCFSSESPNVCMVGQIAPWGYFICLKGQTWLGIS